MCTGEECFKHNHKNSDTLMAWFLGTNWNKFRWSLATKKNWSPYVIKVLWTFVSFINPVVTGYPVQF